MQLAKIVSFVIVSFYLFLPGQVSGDKIYPVWHGGLILIEKNTTLCSSLQWSLFCFIDFFQNTEEHVQTKLPKSGIQLGTLYFGHDADAEHYVSLKPQVKVIITQSKSLTDMIQFPVIFELSFTYCI